MSFPAILLKEYRAVKAMPGTGAPSEYDLIHGVDTEGEYAGWTYLSDLDITSRNWTEGVDYTPIEPERFRRVLASLNIEWEKYTFIDFGSGKGRALLLASEFPFKRIIGMEFSPELHRTAQENIALYRSANQKCRNVESLNVDFVDCALPNEPLVLFFYDPCRGAALEKVMRRIGQSLRGNSYPAYAAYVAPGPDVARLLPSSGFQREKLRDTEWNFVVYERVP